MAINDDWEQVYLPGRGMIKGSLAEYKRFYKILAENATKLLDGHASRVFHADVDRSALYDAFILGLPEETRQDYACHTCRHFIQRYGALALVNDDGSLVPVFWNSQRVPHLFTKSVDSMKSLFTTARVVAEYKPISGTASQRPGHAELGGYPHFYFEFPPRRTTEPTSRLVTALSTQEAAQMLERVLTDYSHATVKTGHQIMSQHKLPHADNHVAAAAYLLDLHAKSRIPTRKGTAARHNLVYRYAVAAFTGSLSQLRSGPLSIVLGLIESNTPFDEIKQQWSALTSPDKYMRPTAAPSMGNLQAAEQLFSDLGLTADDMRRRFLCADEIPTSVKLWQRQSTTLASTTTKPATKTPMLKIFSSLAPHSSTSTSTSSTKLQGPDLPPTPVSFTKFATTILPHASRVYIQLQPRHSINFLITGYEGTKPLLQWHTDSNRVSSYVYVSPHLVEDHGLRSGTGVWNEVSAVVPAPWLWGCVSERGTETETESDKNKTAAAAEEDSDAATAKGTDTGTDEKGAPAARFRFPFSPESLPAGAGAATAKHGISYLFLLPDVHDKSARQLMLFPEWLKGELHGVRRVIERYSNEGVKEVPTDIRGQRGGFVGGAGVKRGAAAEKEKRLVVWTVGRDEGGVGDGDGDGVWEISCFE